jgi:hypothetical protein
MGINCKGSQGQTARAVGLEEEEERQEEEEEEEEAMSGWAFSFHLCREYIGRVGGWVQEKLRIVNVETNANQSRLSELSTSHPGEVLSVA